MTTIRSIRVLAVLPLAAVISACSTTATAYTGLTLWNGTGTEAIQNVTLVVDGGRVVSVVSPDAELPQVANTVSLAGKFVIPGLVEAHAHVSGAWAPDDVTSPEDRVREDLLLYARYGVTTVNSLGDDANVLAVRNAATPTDPRARLLAAGPVIAGNDPAAARTEALRNADDRVDWLKLRVDDNLGASAKMPWDAVSAVMDVGRERNIGVATHLFYLEDAKRLLELGTGMLAHSVRDTDVDAAFITSIRESGICYVPTLVREVSTFVYGERPDWFDDPFFLEHADMAEVARVSAPAFMATTAASASGAAYRVGLVQAQRNLKVLSDAGIPIAMGTDAGPAGRFPGYFEHEELQLMVDAGLTPAQALRAGRYIWTLPTQ